VPCLLCWMSVAVAQARDLGPNRGLVVTVKHGGFMPCFPLLLCLFLWRRARDLGPTRGQGGRVHLRNRNGGTLAGTGKVGQCAAGGREPAMYRYTIHQDTTGQKQFCIYLQYPSAHTKYLFCAVLCCAAGRVVQYLKEQNSKIRVGMADPMGAAMFSYFSLGVLESAGNSITPAPSSPIPFFLLLSRGEREGTRYARPPPLFAPSCLLWSVNSDQIDTPVTRYVHEFRDRGHPICPCSSAAALCVCPQISEGIGQGRVTGNLEGWAVPDREGASWTSGARSALHLWQAWHTGARSAWGLWQSMAHRRQVSTGPLGQKSETGLSVRHRNGQQLPKWCQ